MTNIEVIRLAVPKRQLAWIITGALCIAHGLKGMAVVAIERTTKM